MAEITTTTLADALKTFYLPVIVNQMNYQSNAFFSEIERNSDEVQGGAIKMAMRYGRQGGVGNRAENGTLPTPGARKIKQVEYETQNLFARIMITDKMIEIGQTGQGSFMNVLQTLLQDTTDDAKDSFGRQLYGDGTGKLAKCSAEGPLNTLTLVALDSEHDACQYLAEGMFIDIMDVANAVKVQLREITMVDYDNNQITIDGAAVTVLTTDYIVVNGNYNLELTGLGQIMKTTGSLYGVDRGANKWLAPNIVPVNDEIDEIIIQKGIDTANRRAGADVNFLLCSEGVQRGYQNYQILMKRNTNVMVLKGGYKVLDYNGMPFAKDKYCHKSTLFELVKEDFKIHQIGEWKWMDRDGKVLARVADKPSYEATLVKYGDLGCRRPAGQTKLTGITEH